MTLAGVISVCWHTRSRAGCGQVAIVGLDRLEDRDHRLGLAPQSRDGLVNERQIEVLHQLLGPGLRACASVAPLPRRLLLSNAEQVALAANVHAARLKGRTGGERLRKLGFKHLFRPFRTRFDHKNLSLLASPEKVDMLAGHGGRGFERGIEFLEPRAACRFSYRMH